MRKTLVCMVSVLLLFVSSAWANPVAQTIYYTKATTGLTVPGTYTFRFSLWNSGTAVDPVVNKVWEEEKSIKMRTADLNTYLGSVTPLTTEDFSEQYWVMTELKDTTNNTYKEVGRRTKLNIVPYAMYSVTSETAASGGSVPSVTAGNGLKSTVTANGDVTLNVGAGAGISVGADAVSVKAGGVTNTMLANGAVTLSKISSAGATANQVLGFNGTALGWLNSGFNLPYTGSVDTSGFLFSITNTNASGFGLRVVTQDALRLEGWQPFLTFLDASNGYARSRIQGVGGDVDLFTESYLSSAIPSSFLKLANNGNVGIGAYAPAEKLEVAGNVKASGVVFSDGSKQGKAATDCLGRYEDNGDGTVTDCRTGLVWLKNANCTDTVGGINKSDGFLNWPDAGTWTAALGNGNCGLSDGSSAGDWRMPTKTELMAMIASAKKQGFVNPTLTNAAGTGQWSQGDAFLNVLLSDANYWSSTPDAYDPGNAWVMNFSYGVVGSYGEVDYDAYVLCVRAGQ